MVDGVAQGPGAADSVGLQLGDLGGADAGDGELGRHEEEVAGDQDDDEGKLNEHRDRLPAGWPRHTVGRGSAGCPRRRHASASQQLEAPPLVAAAYSQVMATVIAVIASLDEQLARREAALTITFIAHPDAAIVQSQPGG